MPPPSRHAGRRPRLGVESLESRDVPAFLTSAEVAVGSDAGAPPIVRLIDPSTQIEQAQFLAFDANFSGGVRVAVGDVTGDGYPDLVAAAGPGGGPVVKVYDGKTGNSFSFFAFPSSFTGGVNVAAADVTGDGVADVVVGAGAGGGPQVSVWDARTQTQLASFFAYDPSFRGGVRVAAGDVDGDRKAEVVTAPGFSGGPDVRVWNVAGGLRQVSGFFAYGSSFTGGVYVAAGDVDGDGKAEIVTGAGPTGAPQVSVFEANGSQVSSFFAYDPSFRGGVRVATAHLTGDNKDEVLTVAGPGGAAQVNAYTLPSTAPASFFAYPQDQTTGFFVAGSPVRLQITSSPLGQVSAAFDAIRQTEQSQVAALQAALAQASRVPNQQVVVVNNGAFPFFPFYGPWWYGPGFGLGLGLGFGGLGGFYQPVFYDAPGLYGSLNSFYSPTFFSAPAAVSLGFVDPGINTFGPGFADPGYFNPSGYPVDPGLYDPGLFSGGTGFVDPGFGDFGGDFGGFGDFGGDF